MPCPFVGDIPAVQQAMPAGIVCCTCVAVPSGTQISWANVPPGAYVWCPMSFHIIHAQTSQGQTNTLQPTCTHTAQLQWVSGCHATVTPMHPQTAASVLTHAITDTSGCPTPTPTPQVQLKRPQQTTCNRPWPHQPGSSCFEHHCCTPPVTMSCCIAPLPVAAPPTASGTH